MQFDGELMKGSTATIVLSLLDDEPMYGYQIVKEIERRTKGLFMFKEGTLYPMLHKLENQRMIKGKWEEKTSGRRRKYYYLTSKGRKAMAAKREEWRNFSWAVNAIVEGGYA